MHLGQVSQITGTSGQPVYFDALIRTEAVVGAPNAISLVAARVLHP